MTPRDHRRWSPFDGRRAPLRRGLLLLFAGALSPFLVILIVRIAQGVPFGNAYMAQSLLALMIAAALVWFGSRMLVLRWLEGLDWVVSDYRGGNFRSKAINFDRAPLEFRDLAATIYRMGAATDRSDRRLRQAIEHQHLLAREIHHRVRNNLQIITSLLGLQIAQAEDAGARRILVQTRVRVSTLALVHNLLYEAGEEIGISSKLLLTEMCQLLSATLADDSRIHLDCDFVDEALDLDAAVPVALWLLETVANAYQHGFPDSRPGQIAARLIVGDDLITVSVTDDGIGFDYREAGSYIGLRMIAGIGRQLGGRTETISGQYGTRSLLMFPRRNISNRLPGQ